MSGTHRTPAGIRVGIYCVALLVACFAGAASAAELAPISSESPVACDQGTDVLGLTSILDQPEPVPQALCPQGFCSNNQDCRDACPTALTANCYDYVCHYTYSGGGGGGGPSCNAFCTDTADCIAACPRTPGVYCSGWVCQN